MTSSVVPVPKTRVRYVKPGSRFITSDGKIYVRHYAVNHSSVASKVVYRCLCFPDGSIKFFAGTDLVQRWP